MKVFLLILGLLIILPVYNVSAQVETVYPAGYNIACQHSVSATEIDLGDTLTIKRVLVNDESFSLSGLYFSTCLPPELVVASQVLEIGGVPVSVTAITPTDNMILTGYKHYNWVVDSPDTTEDITLTVAAGDSLCLTLTVVPSTIGTFLIPFKASSFFGNNQSFFSTTTEVDTISVLLLVDVADDQNNLPPDNYSLSVRTYPNPFNGSTTIAFEGTGLTIGELNLNIFNTLGQLVYTTQIHPNSNQGIIWWSAEESLSSGIYFYRLSNDYTQQTGKMLLLK